MRIRHGFAFKGEHFVSDGDKVLLSPGNFRIGGGLKLKGSKEKYYNGDFPGQFELVGGDVIIAMTDLTQEAPILGSPVRIPSSGRYLHNQRLGLVTDLDTTVLTSSYLFYVLCDDSIRAKIRASATGSTVRHTSPERVLSLTVSLPPLTEQLKVGAVLAAFDDLIEINRRRIDVLEEAIHAEFRARFDFEAGIDWAEASRVVPFTALVDVNPRVPTPSGEVRYLPMSALSTTDMTLGGFETRARATGVKFMRGDTLMARITPSLQNGKTGYVYGLADNEVACGSTELIVLRARSVSPYFAYCLARSARVRSVAIGSMSGATGRQRVSTACFDELRVVAPSPEAETSFSVAIGPTFDLIHSLSATNENLLGQRDLLLPKLISGEIDVSGFGIDSARIQEQESAWRQARAQA